MKTVEAITDKQKKITYLGGCPCNGPCKDGESGLVVGIVVVKQYDASNALKSAASEANPIALQEFSESVRQKWNLGACENSVLITIATEPKQYGLSIGERANKILNETWLTAILEENFGNRNTFNLNTKLNDILYMYHQAIEEELRSLNDRSDDLISSLTQPNNSGTLLVILILCILIVLIVVISLIAFVFLRHRKENDDVSIRDVWTKKFWLKSGNQYKEAKQNESGDKDLEKNEEEEVKAKLASTEDLKIDEGENGDEEKIQYPKLSKV